MLNDQNKKKRLLFADASSICTGKKIATVTHIVLHGAIAFFDDAEMRK